MTVSFNKILASIEENFYNLGYSGRAKYRWSGNVTPGTSTLLGNDIPVNAIVYNFTENRYPIAGDLAFIAVLRHDKVAGLSWPKAMTTQKHAYDNFSQASSYAEVYIEAPELDTSAADPTQADIDKTKFIHDLTHIFRGQLGSRTELNYTRNTEVPAIAGVAGKDSTDESAVNYTKMGVLLPYGRIAVPGELA